MRRVRLGDFLEVQPGFAFKTEHFTSGEGLPLIRIRDLARSTTEINYSGEYKSDFVVNKGDYLIGMDGNFRCYRWQGETSLLNQRVCRLRNFREDIDPEYVFYVIQRKLREIENNTSFVTVKHLSAKQVQNVEIPLPPLSEQRRIVDLLYRAEGILRLRRDAEMKTAELIPAFFLDMFGDPATNPKGWKVEPFGKHAEIPSVVRTPDIEAEADMLCMGADSIESMSGNLVSKPTVRDVLPKSGKYRFDAGDVLYSKIRPYLAKATLAYTEGYCSADMYPLRCGPTLRPMFLLSLLLSRAFTEYATAESVRASMPKLNREALFKYLLPLPPVDLQEIFSERAGAVRAIQSQQSIATAKAQATFDALLARIFGKAY